MNCSSSYSHYIALREQIIGNAGADPACGLTDA